jgi:hypothetical protein
MHQAQSEGDIALRMADKICSQESQAKSVSHSPKKQSQAIPRSASLKKQSEQAHTNLQVSTMCQTQAKGDIASRESQQVQETFSVPTMHQVQSEENIATMNLFTKSSSQTCVTSEEQSQQAQATSQILTMDQSQSKDDSAHKNCSQENQATTVSQSTKGQFKQTQANLQVTSSYQAQSQHTQATSQMSKMSVGQLIETMVVIWFIFLLLQQVIKTFSIATKYSDQSKKNMRTIKLFTRSLEPKIPEQATTSENQAHYCTLLSQVHLTHFLHQKENALGNRLNLPPGRTQLSLLESHLLTALAQLTIHKQLLARHNQPQNVNKIHTVMAETIDGESTNRSKKSVCTHSCCLKSSTTSKSIE